MRAASSNMWLKLSVRSVRGLATTASPPAGAARSLPATLGPDEGRQKLFS